MAEQARAKKVEETDLSQDDPLAELANIMGMTDDQQLGVSADEIELELERELLGDVQEEAGTDAAASEASAEDQADDPELEASFDDELTGELEDVLAGMDEDGAGDEAIAEATYDDNEESAGELHGEYDTGAEADEDPFREIFAQPSEDMAAGDDEMADGDEPGETYIENMDTDEDRAADPYAAEYRASLKEADEEEADSEGEPAASSESGVGENSSFGEDVLMDDLRALADAAEGSAGEAAGFVDDMTATSEPDLELGDAGLSASIDENAATGDTELSEEDGRRVEMPEPEIVGWDVLEASDNDAAGLDESSQPADTDDVDEELDSVFGEFESGSTDLGAEDNGHSGAAFHEADAEADISDENVSDVEEHFDERVAALFGHAVQEQPAAEEEPAGGEDIREILTSEEEAVEVAEESGPESDQGSTWPDEAEHRDEDMVSEPLAALPVEKIPAAEQTTRSGDANLEALAALERAVSELTNLGKSSQPAQDTPGEGVPEVGTLAIEENVPPVHDDLEIPDLPKPEQPARPIVFDDLESEITAGFDGPETPEAGEPDDETADDDLLKEFDAIFEEDLTPDGVSPAGEEHQAIGGAAATSGAEAAAASPSYDRWSEESAPLPGNASKQGRSLRGPMVAAVIGGVAVIGVIGAFMYFGGGSGGNGTPAIIKADNEPVKVKPADPGGKTVPNQDNKVYQRVSGEKADTTPQQKELVSKAEEPVDIAGRKSETAPAGAVAPADNGGGAASTPVKDEPAGTMADTTAPKPPAANETATPAVNAGAASTAKDEIQQAIEAAKKSDERLLPGVEPIETPQAEPSDNLVALTPRRVRTMIVKPDGTLVERPEDNQAAAGGAAEGNQNAEVVSPDSAKALDDAAKKLTETAKPATSQTGQMAKPQQTEAASDANNYPVTPEKAPIIPSRPADQPVTVVGTTKKEGNGAATTAPQQRTQIASAAAANGYTVQIASQPSPEAAQQTSSNLAKRYETVIGNRQIVIVPAEISGRGTYYRVRVQAQSLADANDLCSRYKAAGGECFVARP